MATNTREKGAARRENRDRRPQAHVKHVRISSRKVIPVINLIRGKHVEEAQAILKFTPKAASPVVLKLLNSAIANAETTSTTVPTCSLLRYANPGPPSNDISVLRFGSAHTAQDKPYQHRVGSKVRRR